MSKRLHYFFLHILASLIIAILIIGAVILFWYPLPLSTATGVESLLVIMFIVDVIIGPLMSLLVYKEDKKTLKFDLLVIVFIQISALCYGIYTVEKGRPVWIVYSIDRFELVRNNEITLQPNVRVKPEYQVPSLLGPSYVAVNLSSDKEQKESDMFNAVMGMKLAQQPNRYVPFSTTQTNLLENAQNLNLLQNFNTQNNIDKILEKYPHADAWLPLKASAVDMVVLINKEKAEVVKIVDLRPWK